MRAHGQQQQHLPCIVGLHSAPRGDRGAVEVGIALLTGGRLAGKVGLVVGRDAAASVPGVASIDADALAIAILTAVQAGVVWCWDDAALEPVRKLWESKLPWRGRVQFVAERGEWTRPWDAVEQLGIAGEEPSDSPVFVARMVARVVHVLESRRLMRAAVSK